ncbi:MAG: efflux RND transporter periplasmic adaptor subunit [Prosthecobacter sp.]|uniref:efflux RND transporter periplasmic adaptor subunit n=1 Tax=Prosthecobacter sp. TaxID=1965333 RepID=UPI0019EF1AC7|nr:efflux RND transporter periplasmic adaptor subunit [Prosthecobacter sp.]MBE2287350.1 efflux RND transporter periplasmic adaptor subunit [Prosthecobacter sp.]
MKTFLTLILLVAAAAAGWFLRGNHSSSMSTAPASTERKVLFYQSAMHPWIKSDKPGRCTICGMELTPVYEGDKGFDAGGGDVVPLTQNQIQVMQVQTVEAKVQPLMKTLRVAGMMDDDERRHRIISAYVDGRVDQLFANHHGVEVVAGEPLALIYSPALLQAEREYRQLTGELKKNTALRLRQMGLTPAQIEALEKKPADALNSEILSPLTGTVVEHDVYEGQYVTMGQKLFAIADFSIMWFQFRAYEQDMPWIKLGQKVEVTTPSVPGKTFTGEITFIDPNFDEATRSTQVRVELPNPLVNGRRELLHRLYADGSVKVELREVLTVPKSTVMQTGPEAVVYVDQGGGAYARSVVKIGRRGDSLLEILSGIKPGDKIVTNGNLLIDGQAEMNRSFMSPVQPMAPAMAMPDLTAPQQQVISNFIKVADAMAAALSADDLAAFNKASEPAMMQTGELIDTLKSNAALKPKLDALDKARHFHGFTDIMKARIAFHTFSTAVTALIEPLRTAKGAPEFKVWECMMVNQIIPDVPAKGRWVQLGTRPGHNPYFGADMLECVKEIQP